MKSFPAVLVVLAALLLVVACAPESPSEAPEGADQEAESAEMADTEMDQEAAVDAVREAYVASYNQADAEAVAELFTEDAVTLFADGGVSEGREQIRAGHEETFASNPEAQIDPAEVLVMDDIAVQRGTYSVQMNPAEGESTGFSGSFITELQRVEGEWKIAAVTSNWDSAPPPGIPAGTMPDEIPEDLVDSPIASLTSAYEEHFNAGDAAAVAELFSEDAWAGFAGSPAVEGREAIQAQVQERLDMGSPQLTIHTIAVEDMGEGWHVAGGWYEMAITAESGQMAQGGNWMTVTRTNDSGEQEIAWFVSNAAPNGM